jgi:hypothetical protein
VDEQDNDLTESERVLGVINNQANDLNKRMEEVGRQLTIARRHVADLEEAERMLSHALNATGELRSKKGTGPEDPRSKRRANDDPPFH